MYESRYEKSVRVDLPNRRSRALAVFIPSIVMAGIVLMCAPGALGVILDASSFVAVRHLVPPPADPVAAPNRDDQSGASAEPEMCSEW